MDSKLPGRLLIGQSEPEDLELLGDRSFTIGVPVNADPEFKKYVFAAAKTFVWGNISVDNVLKRYGASYREWFTIDPESEIGRYNAILAIIKNSIKSLSETIRANSGQFNGKGLGFAIAAFVRLQSTFRAAIQLIRLNLPFESQAIMRLGLEQLAYANAVSKLNDDIFDNTFIEIKPNATIGDLKQIIPYSGRLYGTLSNWAHISPKLVDSYFKENDNTHHVILESFELTRTSLLFLSLLRDCYFILAEHLFSSALFPLSHINIDDGSLISNRPSLDLINDNSDIFTEEVLNRWKNYII